MCGVNEGEMGQIFRIFGTIPPCFFDMNILHRCFMLVSENMGHFLFYGFMLQGQYNKFIEDVNAVRAAHEKLQRNREKR
jgi:hypothetical protein